MKIQGQLKSNRRKKMSQKTARAEQLKYIEQLGKEPKQYPEQRGMDMSLPGAQARWTQILNWVCAGMAPEHYGLNFGVAPAAWAPRNEAERVEEFFLRKLISAETPARIGAASCPSFSIKKFNSAAEAEQFAADELDRALRCLAESFQLQAAESAAALQLANLLRQGAQRPAVIAEGSLAISLCARQYNIIRQAVETAQRLARLDDKEAVAAQAAAAAVQQAGAQQSAQTFEEEWPTMLTISQAAQYCNCDKRTIHNYLHTKVNPDGSPMLKGVTGQGHLLRIPRVALDPYRRVKRPRKLVKQAGKKKS